jgi:hypothetical protein
VLLRLLLFPFRPTIQQQLFRSKFRAGLRLVHRCRWVLADGLFSYINEKDLDYYVKKYIQKRLSKLHKSDLAPSLFVNDVSFWTGFKKREKDGLGHFFSTKESQGNGIEPQISFDRMIGVCGKKTITEKVVIKLE